MRSPVVYAAASALRFAPPQHRAGHLAPALEAEVARLEAENARLRALVESAFAEGCSAGYSAGSVKTSTVEDARRCWLISSAKLALEQQP